MGKRLQLEPHLSAAELEHRYRAAKEPHERRWWQILWLLTVGHTAAAVAAVTGSSRSWIGQSWSGATTRKAQPACTIASTRPPGELSRCSPRRSRRSCAGRWPGPRQRARGAGRLAGARHGRLDEHQARPASRGAAGLGLSPAPSGPQTPPATAAAPACAGRPRRARCLQKTFRPLLRAVATAFPDATVEAWARDEHRIGLKPLLRRIWAPMGQRPRAIVQHRFRWRSLVGFVHPASGLRGARSGTSPQASRSRSLQRSWPPLPQPSAPAPRSRSCSCWTKPGGIRA
jgi:hypothetical protein